MPKLLATLATILFLVSCSSNTHLVPQSNSKKAMLTGISETSIGSPSATPTPSTIAQETINCNGMCSNGDGTCLACTGEGGSPYAGGLSVTLDPNNEQCIYVNGVHRCYSNPCSVLTTGYVQNNAVDATAQCVATQTGSATAGRHCSVGPSMYGVGDTLSPSNSSDVNVKDVNWLSNVGYMTGMMYKGVDKLIYIQPYFNNEGGIQLGASIGWVSATVNEPTGWGPVMKWNGKLPPGTRVHKCFQGGEYIPGTWGEG
jgi:hypothetical protein